MEDEPPCVWLRANQPYENILAVAFSRLDERGEDFTSRSYFYSGGKIPVQIWSLPLKYGI